MFDYKQSNALSVQNTAELKTQIWETSHTWMTSLNEKDVLFVFPLWEHYTAKLAFTLKGILYIFNRLPRGIQISIPFPTDALVKILAETCSHHKLPSMHASIIY